MNYSTPNINPLFKADKWAKNQNLAKLQSGIHFYWGHMLPVCRWWGSAHKCVIADWLPADVLKCSLFLL